MTSVRRSLAISFLEKYVMMGITIISYFLLARLLTPDEIGIYSVAAALIGTANIIRDFGVGNFLIQEKTLTDAHKQTALGVSLLIGATICIVVLACSSLIGSFYNDDRMTHLVRIIALNFIITPFGSVSLSLLRRELKFQRLLAISVASAVVGFVVTIGLALGKSGPQSLAWGAMAANVAMALGAVIARGEGKLQMPSLSEWRQVLSFGGQTTLVSVVTNVAMDINDLVVGKVMGFAPVAVLSRAQGLMNLFHRDILGAVRGVAFPAFARSHREGIPLEPQFVASVTAITVFAWPFYGMISLFPLEILRLMFGPQWDAAKPLVPIFACAGALSAIFTLIPGLMIAVGRIDLATKADLVLQPIRIVAIVFAAVMFESILACAIAFCLAFALGLPIFLAFKQRCVPNDYKAISGGLLKSLQVSAATLAIGAMVSYTNGIDRAEPIGAIQFALICLATAASWVGAAVLFKHPIALEPMFKRLTLQTSQEL